MSERGDRDRRDGPQNPGAGDGTARPVQVTVAGWVVSVASFLLVVAIFEAMGALRSVDTRLRFEEALTNSPVADLLTIDDMVGSAHVLLLIAGGAAAASVILGMYALRRHRGARIAVSVLAVPILLASPFSGGLWGAFIAASAAMLWTAPARAWFAGRPYAPPTPKLTAGPPTPRTPTPPTAVQGDPTHPGTDHPPLDPPLPVATATGIPGAHAAARFGSMTGRPRAVLAAAVLTWLGAGAFAMLSLLTITVVLGSRDRVMAELLKELEKNPAWNAETADLMGGILPEIVIGTMLVLLVISLFAITLAFLVLRRALWAWVLLLVLAGFAALTYLIAFPVGLLFLPVPTATLVLLLLAPTRAWITRRGGTGSPGAGPPSGPHPPAGGSPPLPPDTGPW